MAGWFSGAWFDGQWWEGDWWAGGGALGGGGAVPEEFAFSIRNQRVSNHAAAARRSVLKPGHFFSDDDVERIGADTAREFRKRILDAEREEEEAILLLLLGFE